MHIVHNRYNIRCIRFYILMILFIAASPNTGASQVHKTLEEQVVNLFNNKKIIMLADFRHSNALPKTTIINLLNKWISMVINNKCQHLKLCLVLEEDDHNVRIINDYIQKGDWNVFRKYRYLHRRALSCLEFYARLRNIIKKIESLNSKRNIENRINFKIIAGEYNPPKVLKQSLGGTKNESIHWFVYKRDSNSAKKIIQYTQKFPEHKILIFYGTAHLFKLRSRKASRSKEIKNNLYGYWLAYYLKKHFGDKNVLSINQVSLPGLLTYLKRNKKNRILQILKPYSSIKKSILIDDPSFPWNNGYDNYIFRTEKPILEFYLYLLFSKTTLRNLSSEVTYFSKFLPGKYASIAIKSCLNFLEVITGKNLKSVNYFLNMFSNNKIKTFHRLSRKKLYKRFHKRLRKFIRSPRHLRYQIRTLGFNNEVFNEVLHHSWRKKSLKIWKKNEKNFLLLQAIGLNWIGISNERYWAKKHLIKVTGINYKKPYKYLQWYRKKILGVNY